MPNKMKDDNEYPRYLFHKGESFTADKFLGAHRMNDGSVVFRVWAPNAREVRLLCDTVDWLGGRSMDKLSIEGVWETTLPAELAREGMCYKYKICSRAGDRLKSDPYAFTYEKPGGNSSVLWTKEKYRFTDGAYMERRRQTAGGDRFYPYPLNIYEVHLASFMTKDGLPGGMGGYLNYREIAHRLADYAAQCGYTHVELLPITEYPYDGSWGYQVTGYFAPTSRFGTPDDFKYFVNYLHNKNIGVILDFVPAHFPKDEFGLYEFDGGPLYEYANERKEQPSWGTHYFDLARNEVRCFLISSAMFWLRECHIDGLRIDAVAAMLYLDFDRKPGEWVPNIYGGRINLESVEFLKRLNYCVHAEFPDVLTIAEESTAYPKVTGRVEDDGLGFSLKWNMGWANDMFDYVKTDPAFRSYHHSALTFPMMYAYSERYVLPVSHDEVVHCKKSLIDKMFGNYDQKFAGMRTFLMFQMTFPGKKLIFMGSEFGQFREWDYQNQLEWFMLDYPAHRQLWEYSKSLNHFYLSHKELYEDDFTPHGFSWIDPDRSDLNLVSYIRRDLAGNEMFVVLNFSGSDIKDYHMRIPTNYSSLEIVFSTYGSAQKTINAWTEHGKKYVSIDVGSLSGLILKGIDDKQKEA